MALDKIEQLLEKYFEAETSIAEENELRVYFSSQDVAQHLQQYQLKNVFGLEPVNFLYILMKQKKNNLQLQFH